MFLTDCASAEEANDNLPRTYLVASIDEHVIAVDGVLGKSEWPADGWESNLIFPWQQRKAPRTEFCSVTDGKHLLVAFRCDDADVVIGGSEPDVELAVAEGDRVELFFARSPALGEYYCIEISPAGRVLDYKASFYRSFADSWDCPGLVVGAKSRKGGYVVELAIPLTTLRDLLGLGELEDHAILAGVFRAEFSHTHTNKPKEEWISWVRPIAEEPDFHIPSAFGRFRIESGHIHQERTNP
ncbi:MAG: carbohydrate-binding family 9-like protein [Pirellulales bacterium]|nr:carbohydrate-binding family 9-like protein [Pirellulales bacterium]